MARTVAVGNDNLGGGVFDPAPVGTKVKATIHEIEEVLIKSGENAGKPQLVVSVKIQEDFKFLGKDGKPQMLKGREVRYNNVPIYEGAKNKWVLGSFAQAVGWTIDEDGNVEIPETSELYLTQGKEVVVKLGIRTNQNDGNQYNTVAGWMVPSAKTTPSPVGGGAGGGAPAGPGVNPWADAN